MVVLEVENNIVGFLQIIKSGRDELIIDLIAVKKEFQGKGYAKEMVSFAIDNCFKQLSIIKVGTQLDNISSLKFYNSLGFNIDSSSYIYHYHSN